MTEEPDFPDDLDELDDDEPAESPTVTIEIAGLSLYTRHGVTEAERELGQRLVDRYGTDSVRVKASKPEPPIPLPVDEVSVEVEIE